MQKERPLSPHLQVYKPQITSILSVFHRGTGVFLAMGAPLLVLMLAAIAQGAESYATFTTVANHWMAKLFILGWTFAAYYHLCNGVRHLFWDIGKGYQLTNLRASGVAVLISASALTALTLALVLYKTGGFS